jgi:hypothetical protein
MVVKPIKLKTDIMPQTTKRQTQNRTRPVFTNLRTPLSLISPCRVIVFARKRKMLKDAIQGREKSACTLIQGMAVNRTG